MKKTALCAAALSAAMLLCGCATEYPAEAYENHPVSDVLAQYVAENAGDTGSIQFDDEILQQTNLQSMDEGALRSALGDEAERCIGTARRYLYSERTFTQDGGTVSAPIVYVFGIRDDLQFDEDLSTDEDYIDEPPALFAIEYEVSVFDVLSFQFLEQEGGTLELIACSNFAVARVEKTYHDIMGDAEKPSESYTLTQFGPYVDDAITPYLAGERTEEDMRLSKLTVTYGETEIGAVPLARGRE